MSLHVSPHRFYKPRFSSQTAKSAPPVGPIEDPSASESKEPVQDAKEASEAKLKRSGLKTQQKESMVYAEQARLEDKSIDLNATHLALLSVKSQNNQPVFVLKGTKRLPLKLENKPATMIAYKAGQHIQIGNTLYKVTPSSHFVKISDNANLVNQLCPEGLGKLHCSQGQMSNCNSLAELMAAFNEPSGLLVRHILNQFSEAKVDTPEGPLDCFSVRFGNFEIQIPKKHLTNEAQETVKDHAKTKKEFKAKHPLLNILLRPAMLIFNHWDLKNSDKESYWLTGNFDTTHAVSGSPLVVLLEKAHYEFIGLQEYREAYRRLYRQYPSIHTIEPGFNQREDIIATIDQAQARGWSGNPHRLDRTHSMRAQRNSKWHPSRSEALPEFLSQIPSPGNPASIHPFFQMANQTYPNALFVSTWNFPEGQLKKFQLKAWRLGTKPSGTDQPAGFKTALEAMPTWQRTRWNNHLKAFLKDQHENGIGMLVIGSRKSKDHIEEIESTIELLNPLKTEDGKIQADVEETEKSQNKKSATENHAYTVKEIMYDADSDQYALNVQNPHGTKRKPTLISWDDLLGNFDSISYFEYSPSRTLNQTA